MAVTQAIIDDYNSIAQSSGPRIADQVYGAQAAEIKAAMAAPRPSATSGGLEPNSQPTSAWIPIHTPIAYDDVGQAVGDKVTYLNPDTKQTVDALPPGGVEMKSAGTIRNDFTGGKYTDAYVNPITGKVVAQTYANGKPGPYQELPASMQTQQGLQTQLQGAATAMAQHRASSSDFDRLGMAAGAAAFIPALVNLAPSLSGMFNPAVSPGGAGWTSGYDLAMGNTAGLGGIDATGIVGGGEAINGGSDVAETFPVTNAPADASAGAGSDSQLGNMANASSQGAPAATPGITQAAAPVVNSVAGGAGINAAAPAAGGTGALGTAATGLSLADAAKGLASGVAGAGQLAGGVAAINAITGDPLGLNKGADQANAAATNASNASAAAQTQLAQIAQDQWDYYKKNYQPVESNLINQAMTAGSPDEFARARGAAAADVTGAYDQARKQAASRLQSFGLNPGSPAYQATLASTDLAEAGSKAGALTTADNTTRNLAYSKALDVAGLGRNIPAQSAASTANAANASNNAAAVASNRQIAQNQQGVQNTQALGYGLNSIGSAAQKWFSTPTTPAPSSGVSNPYDPSYESGLRFASGGKVRHITPHMRYASGGGVGTQGLDTMDASNMGTIQGPGTETSDSIPAEVDGQEKAQLSSGEFVMNAEVPKLTGDEILEAINKAGLEKRGQTPDEAQPGQYARGGRVMRYGLGE